MRHTLAILLIFLATQAAAGGVYRWTDDDGNVHFGDRPPSADTEKTDIPRNTTQPDRDAGYSVMEQAAKIDARDRAALERRNEVWARDVAEHEARKAEEGRLRAASVRGEIVVGLPADQVRRIKGRPDTVNRSDYGRGWEEQWVFYSTMNGDRETDYIYVKDGVVTAIQLRR